MNLDKYIEKVEIIKKTEIEKITLIFYYFFKIEEKKYFNLSEANLWFNQLNLSRPNLSRLRDNIKSSTKFVNGPIKDTFKLHAREIARLTKEIPDLIVDDEEIHVGTNEILPESLYLGTRGYIEKLSIQINCSYEQKVFDGCAVLMRRLLEILLIHSYEFLQLDSEIKNGNGEYLLLNDIVDNAKKNKKLNLSRNTREHINDFRKLGNFSAHKIYYNCKKDDIRRVLLEYRACIEELLYKSGIKK
jgi:hypothetical protein